MNEKAKYLVDLHCHSTASDGTLKPTDLVALAVSRGLQVIGLTDHDTIKGWKEAEDAAQKLGITLIKGIEINTDWRGQEIHILGYGMDEDNVTFRNRLYEIQEKRVSRVIKIIEKLKSLGLEISLEEISSFSKGESIGRPHVAQALVTKGYAPDTKTAFNYFLKIGAPAYVPRYKLQPEQAVKIIRNAGGVAVLAHPGSQKIDLKQVQELVTAGLQGIEICHPDHTPEQNKIYKKIATELKLIMTGGSDYHGPEIRADIAIGNWGVNMEDLANLRQMMIIGKYFN